MIFAVLLIVLQQPTVRLAADLRPGLELHYSSEGRDTPPWSVDSVATGVTVMPGADCARFHLRRAPQQPANESRLCIRRDTLFAWDARRESWAPQRPVAPSMVLVQPRANGDTVRYTTGHMSYEMISGTRVQVIATTVLTVDSLGQPKRRLRERYAISLATATGGVFEVPDASNGWRAEQTFELTRLGAPRNR